MKITKKVYKFNKFQEKVIRHLIQSLKNSLYLDLSLSIDLEYWKEIRDYYNKQKKFNNLSILSQEIIHDINCQITDFEKEVRSNYPKYSTCSSLELFEYEIKGFSSKNISERSFNDKL